MLGWLNHAHVLLKEFKLFARDTTVSVCKSIEAPAEQAGLFQYVNNSQGSKAYAAIRMVASDVAAAGSAVRTNRTRHRAAVETSSAAIGRMPTEIAGRCT